MIFRNIQRAAVFGLGAAALVGASMMITHHAMAADTKATPAKAAEVRVAQANPGYFAGQPGAPGQPPPPGGFGGEQFRGGPGGPNGFGGPPPMMMGGGPASLTATQSTVYVLRGNTLYAFNAQTLKPTAQVELPRPQFGPGGGAQRRQGGNPPPPGDDN